MARESRVFIVGSGVVGTATGEGFRSVGHELTFIDTSQRRVQELRARGLDARNELELVEEPPSFIFLTLPTPNAGLQYDLSAFTEGTAAVGRALRAAQNRHTIVVRSTVPPGTTEGVVQPLLEEQSGKTLGMGFALAAAPEFLRSASAAEDFRHPWMTVIASRSARTVARMRELLAPFGGDVRTFSDPASAELVKCAHNLFNATKISFWNEIWLVAQRLGVEADPIAAAVAKSAEGSTNPHYGIRGGAPYGGMCLPKDTRGFLGFAASIDLDVPLLRAVVEVNERMRQLVGDETGAAQPKGRCRGRGDALTLYLAVSPLDLFRQGEALYPLLYYVALSPLGVLGLIRWSFWLVRRVPAVLYLPVRDNYRLPMSVVVPVYQEDPEIFATAIESWLANQVDEVVLVIDATDRACLEVARRYPVTVIVTEVPGKRDALRRGWNACSTELVALVDSDTIWATNVAEEVCKPFADPRIGGVGTRQNVYRSRGFLPRINDMFLDHRYYDENACQTFLGRAVSCLSGRTAVYRRALLREIEQDFMNETFWGVPCLSGDDKRLTTLILERGHLTYMQRTARVWSTFPSTWKTFMLQRLRWARNTWRSDLRALSRRWVWRRPFLAYTMLDKAISCFTLLVGPTFMALGVLHRNWLFVASLAVWWQISRSAKLLPHLRRRPSSFFLLPGYIVVSWMMALIKIGALLTIRRQRWLTRQVAVEGGAVIRTGVSV